MYNIQQEDIDILRQSTQHIFVKIELLNTNLKTINELQGELINGSTSSDSESDIRNTADVTFIVKDDTYLVGENSIIWFNHNARLSVGVLHQRTRQIRWYPLCIFVFTENNYNYDSVTNTVTVSLVDMVCNLNGVMGGTIQGLNTKIIADTDIRTAMISTVTQLGKIKQYMIDDIRKKVPYDLEFGTDSKVYDIITELRDLYPAWETYFDEIGTFIYQPIPSCIEDSVVLDAKIISELGLVSKENRNTSLAQVSNVIDIWGKCINSDRFASTSTFTSNVYSITLDNFTLTNGVSIGFATIEASTSSSLKVNSLTAYPIVKSDDTPVPLEKDKSYVVRFNNNKFYYQGEYQIHGIAKEVSVMPSDTDKQADYTYEGTRNIVYIVNPDSPYTVDKIGERRSKRSGNDYSYIYTEELAIARAKYELWKSTRLQDSLNLEMLCIPWLCVNQKIEYTSLQTKKTEQYIIKKINKNIDTWTMTIEMIKFYPLYPSIFN